MKKYLPIVFMFAIGGAQAASVAITMPYGGATQSRVAFTPSYAYQYPPGADYYLALETELGMSVQLNLDVQRAPNSTASQAIYNNIATGGSISGWFNTFKYDKSTQNYINDGSTGTLKAFRFGADLPSSLTLSSGGTEIFTATAVSDTGELAIWNLTASLYWPGGNIAEKSLYDLYLSPLKTGFISFSGNPYLVGYGSHAEIQLVNSPYSGTGWQSSARGTTIQATLLSATIPASSIATPIAPSAYLLPSGLLALLAFKRSRKTLSQAM